MVLRLVLVVVLRLVLVLLVGLVVIVMIIIHLADRDRLGHLDHRSSAIRDGCEEISETLLERQSVGDDEVRRFEDGPVGEGGLERVGVGTGGNHRGDIESTERR